MQHDIFLLEPLLGLLFLCLAIYLVVTAVSVIRQLRFTGA